MGVAQAGRRGDGDDGVPLGNDVKWLGEGGKGQRRKRRRGSVHGGNLHTDQPLPRYLDLGGPGRFQHEQGTMLPQGSRGARSPHKGHWDSINAEREVCLLKD